MTVHLSSPIAEFSVRSLKNLLDQKKEICLLDVRQSWEIKLCSITDSLNIPLSQLPERLEEIPTSLPVVALCHHGMRSRQAAYFLKENGFADVYNLTGGIDAWAKEIDSTMTQY